MTRRSSRCRRCCASAELGTGNGDRPRFRCPHFCRKSRNRGLPPSEFVVFVKRALITFFALVTLVAVFAGRWLYAQGPLRDPKAALADFYAAEGRAEDMLMDPLILNGKPVVPLVMEAVSNKNMEKRRYAICFLGNGKYREALPLLERILNDNSEINYSQADALEAIAAISPQRAKQLASDYVEVGGLLGDVAAMIVEGRPMNYCARSWWEAFKGHHG